MADVVCKNGLAVVAGLIQSDADGSWLGKWGTGTTATFDDTTVTGQTETPVQTVSASLDALGGYGVNDTVVMTFSYTCDAAQKTIATAGVLDGSSLVCKSSFSGIPVVQSDSIAFTFKLRLVP